jgi:hypothetical protein
MRQRAYNPCSVVIELTKHSREAFLRAAYHALTLEWLFEELK